jgi:hypothetical protein
MTGVTVVVACCSLSRSRSTMASTASSSSSSRSSDRVTRSRCQKDGDGEVNAPKKSLRLVKYCTELGVPRRLMCSGCVHYTDAPASSKVRGDRERTHTSQKFLCQQPWREEGTGYYGNNRLKEIEDFLTIEKKISHHNVRANRMFSPTACIGQMEAEEENVSPLTTPTDANTNSVCDETSAESSDGRKRKKSREEIPLETKEIKSQGHTFVIEGVPRSHVVLHKSYLLRLQNLEQQVKELTTGLSNYRFDAGASSHFMRTLIAVAVSSCPALPLSQAAVVIPIFCAAFLVDAGLLKKTDLVKFSKSFPSESMLRDMVFALAAESSVELGHYLHNKTVFLSCDKGNKKGISHFVKILSWWNSETMEVQKRVLDIDASEGTSEMCAAAIAVSLKKIGSIKLQGQTTDSGGGGVLDGLAKKLDDLTICRPNYLIAPCGLHCLQLAVANPIKMTMGDGGLDKKNGTKCMEDPLRSSGIIPQREH